MKNLLFACLLLVIVVGIGGCAGGKRNREMNDSWLSLDWIESQLLSPDPEARQLAAKILYEAGPRLIPQIRERQPKAKFLENLVAKHDKLLATPSPTLKTATLVKEATEAIDYFNSEGAVKYLVLALKSEVSDVQYYAARTLTAYKPTGRGERQFLVSTCEDFLRSLQPIPQGGEDVVIQQKTIALLTEILAKLRD